MSALWLSKSDRMEWAEMLPTIFGDIALIKVHVWHRRHALGRARISVAPLYGSYMVLMQCLYGACMVYTVLIRCIWCLCATYAVLMRCLYGLVWYLCSTCMALILWKSSLSIAILLGLCGVYGAYMVLVWYLYCTYAVLI